MIKPSAASAAVGSKAVALLLLIHCLLFFPLYVGVSVWSLFCCAVFCDLSTFAIILTGKRELNAIH